MTLVNEDDMGEVSDIVKEVENVIADLQTAECVETQADFIANLECALDNLDSARKSIAELLAQAKKNK